MGAEPMAVDAVKSTTVVARREHGGELDEVLQRYLPALHRYALRQLGNAADAEDAVQDALLSAYQHLAQFRREARMSTWLTAILGNCVRMQRRRRPRATFVSLDDCGGEESTPALSERIADKRPTPEDQCRKTEMKEHLDRIMPRLSPPLLRTFQLRHLEGRSLRETANILGVPESTVKARLTRARCILQRLMQTRLDRRPSQLAVRTA